MHAHIWLGELIAEGGFSCVTKSPLLAQLSSNQTTFNSKVKMTKVIQQQRCPWKITVSWGVNNGVECTDFQAKTHQFYFHCDHNIFV